jgi:hypothetical protein
MDPEVLAARQRVRVVDDEKATFSVPRLLIRGAEGLELAGPLSWDLCYGGLPIAAGELGLDRDLAFIEVASIEPAMDSAGLSIAVRLGDGAPCLVEAICVRPMRPMTRAEATARAKWPDVRNQGKAPPFRRPFLAGIRKVGAAGSPDGDPDQGDQRCVYLYCECSVLLEYRRRRMQGEAGAAPGQAGPDRSS